MMELPRRIADGGAGAWEQSVISSAGLDAPSPEFRQHLAQKLGLASAAVGIATTTTSAAKALGGSLWLKWVALGFAVGLSGMGAAFYATNPAASEKGAPQAAAAWSPTPPPMAPQAVVPANDSAEAASADRAPEPALARGVPAASNPSAPPSVPSAAGPLGTASFATPGQSELAAETAAIQAVRASLTARQADRALRQIDQYERGFPAGLFLLEAEVLRIDSYAELADRASVKQLGDRFLTAHPDSPYARHVRTLLDQGTNR
jgi:hypothetical protein